MREKLRRFLDSWRFWTAIAWFVLALLVVWLAVLNARVQDNIDETNAAVRAQAEAIAFLCDTNAIIEALAKQTVSLLKSDQVASPSPTRAMTIVVFQGYIQVLRERAACVKAERAAVP
jgi:hypothetical protein